MPAVTNSARAGRGDGSVKSPVAWSRWIRVPGCSARTTWLLTLPSGIALTQIEMIPSGAVTGEVSE